MPRNVKASGSANWTLEGYFAQSGASKEQIRNELKINRIIEQSAHAGHDSQAEGGTPAGNGELQQQEIALKSQLEKLLDTRLTAPRARRKLFSKAVLWIPGAVVSRATNVGLSLLGADKRVKTSNLNRGILYALDKFRRKLRFPVSAQRKIITKWCIALGLNAHEGRAMLGEQGSQHFAKFLYDLHTKTTYQEQLSNKQLRQLRDVMTALTKDKNGALTQAIFKLAKGSVFGPNAQGKLQRMADLLAKPNAAQETAKKPATPPRNNTPLSTQPDNKSVGQSKSPNATNKRAQKVATPGIVLGTAKNTPLSTSPRDNVKTTIYHETQVGLECAIHSINNLFGKRVVDRKEAEVFLKKKETVSKIFAQLGGVPDELKNDMHQYTSLKDGLDVSSFPALLDEAMKKQGLDKNKSTELFGDEVPDFIKNWKGDHLVIHTATKDQANNKKSLTNPHYLVFKKRQDSPTGEPRWFKQDSLDPNPIAQTPTEYLGELSRRNKIVTHAWHMNADLPT